MRNVSTLNPYLVSRMQSFGSTIFAQMSELAVQTRSINLGQGFPDFDGPEDIKQAAIRAIEQGHNQYPPAQGIPALREAIALHQKTFNNLSYDPNTEILVTAGATEAIAASLLALIEPGDEVLVFEPFYDSYNAAIVMAQGKITPIPLKEPEWTIDFDYMASVITERTRAVVVNSPHNPTGKVFTEEELKMVAQLCLQHDLIAITDEVYEHLVFEGNHISLAQIAGMQERSIVISSAAKTFSLTGWKIGWLCAPRELAQAARTTKQFLTYVNGAPFQEAIAFALESGNHYTDLIAHQLKGPRSELTRSLTEIGLKVCSNSGTYFLVTDISTITDEDSMTFCLKLPERIGVVAVPMEPFYDTPKSGRTLVRWAFCKTPDAIASATERISQLKTKLPSHSKSSSRRCKDQGS